MLTQGGKLLYISDNAAEYLGHSMVSVSVRCVWGGTGVGGGQVCVRELGVWMGVRCVLGGGQVCVVNTGRELHIFTISLKKKCLASFNPNRLPVILKPLLRVVLV